MGHPSESAGASPPWPILPADDDLDPEEEDEPPEDEELEDVPLEEEEEEEEEERPRPRWRWPPPALLLFPPLSLSRSPLLLFPSLSLSRSPCRCRPRSLSLRDDDRCLLDCLLACLLLLAFLLLLLLDTLLLLLLLLLLPDRRLDLDLERLGGLPTTAGSCMVNTWSVSGSSSSDRPSRVMARSTHSSPASWGTRPRTCAGPAPPVILSASASTMTRFTSRSARSSS